MNENFEAMCRRTGNYSLPWLIRIYNSTSSLYFINDNVSYIYGGHTYNACSFEYVPGQSEHGFNGGGTLNIATADANLAGSINAFIEESDYTRLEVIGALLSGGTVSEIKTYSHSYGSVSWDGKSASFTFDKDDRLSMTFPALIFSHYNNRGN